VTRGHVLLVDDDAALCEALSEALQRRGFRVDHRLTGADGLAAVPRLEPDVVVADINMGRISGMDVCRGVAETAPDVPVVLLTAFGSMEAAIDGIRSGAWDFITKPVEAEALAAVIDRAVQVRRLRAEVRRLRNTRAPTEDPVGMVGDSGPMQRLRDLVARVASTDVTALVTGESGSGKEIVARAIHAQGRRARGPFVAVNCAAMPEALLESELFGHVRGAFTDARVGRTGLFFQAEGGTLFLDEVGELPLPLQPKLLRALQERTARPVGGDRELGFDVRLVVATNRDLRAEVDAGRFRADLYFRLNVVEVPVPPLRARSVDVLLLAQHFVRTSAARFGKAVRGVSSDAAAMLLAYDWPGNVRELANAVERGVALTRFDELTPDDLPDHVRQAKARAALAGEDGRVFVSLAELEREYVRRVIRFVGGNKAAAARILGVDRTTLYRKLGDAGEP
jgi:two-component system response regulator HydG